MISAATGTVHGVSDRFFLSRTEIPSTTNQMEEVHVAVAAASAPSPSTHSFLETVYEAKKIERKVLLQATHDAFKDFVSKRCSLSLHSHYDTFCKMVDSLFLPVPKLAFENKIARILNKLAKVAGQEVTAPNEEILRLAINAIGLNPTQSSIQEALNTALLSVGCSQEQIFKPLLMALAAELEASSKKCINDEDIYKTSFQELQASVKKIALILSKDPDDADVHKKKANAEVLDEIRKALGNPCYIHNKEDEENFLVHFLHCICIASYANSQTTKAYAHIGKKLQSGQLLQTTNQPYETIRNIWQNLQNQGVVSSDVEVPFQKGSKCKKELILNLQEAYSNIPTLFNWPNWLANYFPKDDQRGACENIPGALYEETLQIKKMTIKARTVYTPSPTLGLEVAPEMKATLQGMENRHFQQIHEDSYPYTFLIYTNLQDLSSTFEKYQSFSLMNLNIEYPFSYSGITSAHDTDFFNATARVNRLGFTESYKTAYLQLLLQDANFVERASQSYSGGGFIFPLDEKEEWKRLLPVIVDEAFEIINTNKKEIHSDTLQEAFLELVNLGIIRLHQTRSLTNLAFRVPEKETNVLQVHACKGNIDRGGKTNPSLLWALGDCRWSDFMISSLFSRALLERRRLLFHNRMVAISALIEVVPQNVAKEFLLKIGKTSLSTQVTFQSIKTVGLINPQTLETTLW